MKTQMLKITCVLLSMFALWSVFGRFGMAQDSRMQSAATTVKPPEKTAEQAFKNIKVLNGLPQSKLYPTMRFMAASLGFRCGDCHVIKSFIDAPADDKPEKQTARRMIKMVIDINNTLFQGNPTVSCYTCHRGHRSPSSAPELPLPTGPSSRGLSASTARSMSSAVEILNKFTIAIGGQVAIDRITSLVIKGTTTTAIGQAVAYQSETAAPDKGHEAFALPDATGRPCAGDSRCEYERVINGRQSWLKSGGGVQELVGEQVADQKLTFPLFQILKLKDQYASFRISEPERIDNRDFNVISAVRFDGRSERLYFDAETGLLRRRISYMKSLVGTIPQQTDFEDYREVDGLKLPTTITMSFADPGSRPIIRKFSEIRFNAAIDETKFEKPR